MYTSTANNMAGFGKQHFHPFHNAKPMAVLFGFKQVVTGGGIFLSPLIILFGWEDARKTSGIAATFIVLNSLAGLLGNLAGQVMKTAVRQAANQIGRQLVRGLLGALLGGKGR